MLFANRAKTAGLYRQPTVAAEDGIGFRKLGGVSYPTIPLGRNIPTLVITGVAPHIRSRGSSQFRSDMGYFANALLQGLLVVLVVGHSGAGNRPGRD